MWSTRMIPIPRAPLLTRMCSPPRRARASATAASHSSSRDVGAARGTRRPVPTDPRAWPRLVEPLPVDVEAATFAPAPAGRAPARRPNPPAAPVTMATLPSSSVFTCHPYHIRRPRASSAMADVELRHASVGGRIPSPAALRRLRAPTATAARNANVGSGRPPRVLQDEKWPTRRLRGEVDSSNILLCPRQRECQLRRYREIPDTESGDCQRTFLSTSSSRSRTLHVFRRRDEDKGSHIPS